MLLAASYGFFSSLQFTCLNTLIYSDIPSADTSMASTIASTGQQLSLSFGVAVSSLVTAFFIPASLTNQSPEMIQGLHRAFLVLGGFTMLSALIFRQLHENDGASVSRHEEKAAVEPLG